MNRELIADGFRQLQSGIITALEMADGSGEFKKENWERPGGGGGLTAVLNEGNIIEKGGVNFSAVEGKLPQKIVDALQVADNNFFATGVSIVLHPHNPMVPIIHMNVRYFELSSGEYWFGGGIDLTPHYIDPFQAAWFHQQLRLVCDRHHPDFYSEFKNWADNYFYIKHREETRGIGGIFFDRLNHDSRTLGKEQILDFVMDIGNAFAPIYTSIMKSCADKPYGEAEKHWQLLRRGRYVEFNLVYDKGTKFGLETSGRIESILMSLPKLASWEYDVIPAQGSAEEFTLKHLKKGMAW
jgi:coproporphyrinogen III oxidase